MHLERPLEKFERPFRSVKTLLVLLDKSSTKIGLTKAENYITKDNEKKLSSETDFKSDS